MEEWLQRFTSGSQEGWDEFLERFSRLIYKVFCTKSFYFTREEIEELYQDFLLSLMQKNYRKVHLYEGRNSCSFASYLKKIAINMAIDRRKSLNRKRMVSLQVSLGRQRDTDGAELMSTIDSGHEAPGSILVTQEEALLYQSLLYKLPSPKLLVVFLIVYHKYDREELAEMMETTRQNIDVIFNRCKNKLQELLKKSKDQAQTPMEETPWSTKVLDYKDRILMGERDKVLASAVKGLSRPDELLAGVAFINYLALSPTPDRLASTLKLPVNEVQPLVEKVLKKIIPDKRKRKKPGSEGLV